MHHACAGKVEEFQTPANGKYKLEVWGAQGGNCTWNGVATGGAGGYSIGELSFSQSKSLYVVVGGMGDSRERSAKECVSGGLGGYNGGGNGGNSPNFGGAGGGGATHIAINGNSLLSAYQSTYKSDVLLVAGGGGGAAAGANDPDKHFGGVGGGKEGGTSTTYWTTSPTLSTGGTQNSGYSFGKGQDGIAGYGGYNAGVEGKGGGGGGLWGGYASQRKGDNSNGAGGGGSGYVGNVTNGQTIAGNTSFPSPFGVTETGHAGNGWAKIGWKL